MRKIPQQFYTIKTHIYFIVFLTVFAILFAVLYAPSYGYDTSSWNDHNGLIIPILAAIVMTVTIVSRTIFLFCRGSNLHEREFIAWQVLEWLASCLFCDLFFCLYTHRGFFEILLPVLLIGLSVAIYPYLTFWICIKLQERNEQLNEARQTIAKLKETATHVEEVVQFYDEKNNAKLMVDLNAVYSVESAGNYVNIVYDDNGKLQRYSLRNSMKGVEATCEKHGLIRCHRSYYINPRKIKILRKDGSTTFAEMQRTELSHIPVSPTYAAEVAHAFSSIK